jgi:hypothetical protein
MNAPRKRSRQMEDLIRAVREIGPDDEPGFPRSEADARFWDPDYLKDVELPKKPASKPA